MKSKHIKKWTLAAVTAGMVLSGALPMAAANYQDVSRSSSHYDTILRANELGIMTGYADGTFKPSQKLSRGNVVKALG